MRVSFSLHDTHMQVSQIISLDISGCSIKKISACAFHQIEGLEKLYLHNNKIDEVITANTSICALDTFN